MNKAIILVMATLIFSATAYGGGATMTVGSDTVAPGDTAVVTMDATGDGTQVNISADLFYDDSLMTAQTDGMTNVVSGCLDSLPSGIGGGLTSCLLISPGVIRLSLSATDFVTPIPDAPAFGTISFDTVGGATPGTISPLDLMTVDTNPGDPSDLTSIDGAITFEAPTGDGFYASTPAPGGELALGSAVVGDTTSPAVNLNVQNPSPDTDFEVTGINSMDAQLNTPAAATVPFGDNVDFPFDCTPAARGNQDGAFQVEHDAANGAGTPVDYTFTCAGLAPNVAVSSTTITLNGIIGQPNPTGSINVTNAQDGFTSDANNAVVNTTTDAPEISATSDVLEDATISVDEVDSLGYECSTATPGMFTEEFQIDYDDPVSGGTASTMTVTINCEIINEIAEYESDPAIGSTLDFGDVLNGQTSAPLGVDIGNTDTDAVPNAELEITAANITGPDAAVFTLVTDPTGDTFAADTAPDGTPDAEVTCSPTDGFSTFTATLSIESNDPDDSPAEYPLTCDGDNDVGLDSTPPPGDVDLGIIPPGGDATSNITIENSGTTDPTDLTCTGPTGDPEITLVSPTFPVTLGPGESADIVLNCAPSSPGSFEATLSCEATVPGADPITLDYSLSCIGQAIEVPTLSRIGMLSMILALMAVGFIGFRLRQN